MNDYWLGLIVGCFVGFVFGTLFRGAVADFREARRHKAKGAGHG